MNVPLQWNEVRWNDVATQLNNVHEFQKMVRECACPTYIASAIPFCICMRLLIVSAQYDDVRTLKLRVGNGVYSLFGVRAMVNVEIAIKLVNFRCV